MRRGEFRSIDPGVAGAGGHPRRAIVLGLGALLASAPARAAVATAPKRSLHNSLNDFEPWLLKSTSGPLPEGGLRARFMGVSTILLEAPGHKLLIDGFFSRPSLMRSALPVAPNARRISDGLRLAEIRSLDGLLVAQGHHDHAMDAADVLTKTGGVLVGSRSTLNLARSRGFTGDGHAIVARQTVELPGFTVDAIPSPHSDPNLFKGMIPTQFPRSTWISRYRDCDNLSFVVAHGDRKVFIHPSAALPPGGLSGVQAEVVFLGIGSLKPELLDDYWAQTVRGTGAKLVIPIHWDDFFMPLDDGLRPLGKPLDHARRSLELVRGRAERDGVAFGLMPLFKPVDLPAGGQS